MSNYGIVILAAGESSRMGSPKQLIPYRGKALVRHAVDVALGPAAGVVIVVLGANADSIRPVLRGAAVEIVENLRWAEGMGTSIQVGVGAALSLDGIILTLADLPLIRTETFTALVEAHKSTGKPVVASRYAGTLGVPVFFARECFAELLALKPGQGCKGVILSNDERTFALDCPEAEMDLDTPGDLERMAALPE